jgi:hypothetical protein
MKNNYIFFLAFALFLSCDKDDKPSIDNGGNILGACLLEKISSSDGSFTSYNYNNNKKWETITVSDGLESNTFSLTYDATTSKGPAVFIFGGKIPSSTVLDYNKDNLLTSTITRMDKMDKGIIFGFPATATDLRTELLFEYNNKNQLIKLSSETKYDLTANNVTEPFLFNSYETYEYDEKGLLIKNNHYAEIEVIVAEKVVLKTDYIGYTVFEYSDVSSKLVQNLGITNLLMDIDINGQLYFLPSNGSQGISKVTNYITKQDGGFDSYVSTFTNKNNSSGFLSETVDLSDGETTTYSYTNCK